MVASILAAVCAPAPARAQDARAATPHTPTERAAAALKSGHYEDARRLAESLGYRGISKPATLIAARADMALGQYERARQRLESAVGRAPHDLSLRHSLCDVLALRGDHAALRPLIALTYDDLSMRRIDVKNADDLVAVAAIARLDDNWKDANDLLRKAVRAAPHNARPNVTWGYLFLEKHAVPEAETSFRAALGVDPDDPDAHVGLAAVFLRKRYDVVGAEDELAAALRINGRHAGALALRAELAMDGEDFDTAAALLAEIRRTNARDPRAAWLAAARARLLDDEADYRHERDAHAAVHPADGDFFAEAAGILIRHRRTDDARAVAEEGAAADPRNAHCQSVLGTTLLRLGEEAAGVAALRRAWHGDPYDARTYNLLELYEKVVPHMQTVSTKHLSFRIDPGSRVAIERVVAPFLENTYARYVARYGLEPKGPIVFELYANPDDFAIRTIGLPGLGVAAVCFGRVITSSSPTNGTMNWGMVLAHELAHAFAIELSRSRVPRWFTEGLAELETMSTRPEWTRHAERSLWGAARRGELTPLSALSNAFVRARDPEEATRAYAEAGAVLAYLERGFGFARLRRALGGFATGARGLNAVAAAMGVSSDALERGFHADLAARTSAFDHQYLPTETMRLPPETSRLPPETPRAPSETPRSRPETVLLPRVGGASHAGDRAAPSMSSSAERADSQARLGLAALRRGDIAAAGRAADAALATPGGPDRRAVLFLVGERALALKHADEARATFLKLLAPAQTSEDSTAGGDGYDVRVRLALAEIHRRDLAAAEQHLLRAIAFDPTSAEAAGLMVELLGDPAWHGSRDEDRLRAIAATLRLDPTHAGLARELVFGLARRGRAAGVVDAAPLAIFIEPGLPALHAAFGRALAATGQLDDAASALERALALGASGDDEIEIRRDLDAIRLKRERQRASQPGPIRPP